MEISQEILPNDGTESENFRCSLCNKYLSVFPINSLSSVGNICGRCNDKKIMGELPVTEIYNLQRQTIFENLMNNSRFPCSFDIMGCKVKLNREEIIKHESTCSFKNVICPFSVEKYLNEGDTKCEWNGEIEEVVTHMREKHENYFSPSAEVCLTLSELKSRMILMNTASTRKTVLLKLDCKEGCNTQLFKVFADFPLYKCKQYFCELKIFNKGEDTNGTIILHKDNLTPFVRNFATEENSSYLKVDMNFINEILDIRTVTVHFNIVEKNTRTSQLLLHNSSTDIEPKMEFSGEEFKFEILVCVKCKTSLKSGLIHFVPFRGNVCLKCKDDFMKMPNLNIVRNSTLEMLMGGLNFPCKRRDLGCTFKGIPCDVLKHEEGDCPQAKTNCVVHCNWMGFNYLLYSHIQEKHVILEMNTISKLEKRREQIFLLCFDDKPFLLKLDYNCLESLNFKIFCIGEMRIRYKYDLALIESNPLNIKFLITHICQPVQTIRSCHNFESFSLPLKCLNQFFLNSDDLNFKVNISKIKN